MHDPRRKTPNQALHLTGGTFMVNNHVPTAPQRHEITSDGSRLVKEGFF